MSDAKGHHRITATGLALGRASAKLAQRGLARLAAQGLDGLSAPGMRGSPCESCACTPGTVPNGCMQTQMDLLKAAAEGVRCLCHAPRDGKLCAGWVRLRAELVANPLPPDLMKKLKAWEFSPPDPEEPTRQPKEP